MAYGSITITDLNEAESWYMHIKYAPNGNPLDSQIKDSSTGMSYIGVYTGPSQTKPTTARSYTWTKFVGEDGQPGTPGTDGQPGAPGTNGVSVTKTVPIYYLKIDSTAVPTIADGTEITYTTTGPKEWTKAIPTYVNNGIYYTAVQVFKSSGTSPITTTIVQDQGLTDACKNSAEALSVATNVADDAAGALSIATGVRQHFWSIGSDYQVDSSFTLPAGSYTTEKAIDSFKANPTGGYLITRSDGVYLNRDRYTLASLTSSALKFYKPGTNTEQASFTSTQVAIGVLNQGRTIIKNDGMHVYDYVNSTQREVATFGATTRVGLENSGNLTINSEQAVISTPTITGEKSQLILKGTSLQWKSYWGLSYNTGVTISGNGFGTSLYARISNSDIAPDVVAYFKSVKFDKNGITITHDRGYAPINTATNYTEIAWFKEDQLQLAITDKATNTTSTSSSISYLPLNRALFAAPENDGDTILWVDPPNELDSDWPLLNAYYNYVNGDKYLTMNIRGEINISDRYKIDGISQPFIYRSASNPSGGENGDVWLVYTN